MLQRLRDDHLSVWYNDLSDKVSLCSVRFCHVICVQYLHGLKLHLPILQECMQMFSMFKTDQITGEIHLFLCESSSPEGSIIQAAWNENNSVPHTGCAFRGVTEDDIISQRKICSINVSLYIHSIQNMSIET